MKRFAVVLFVVAVMGGAAFGQVKRGVEGVWELTGITMSGKTPFTMKVTQPSVYTFTKKYFSKIYIGSEKPRPVLEDYTKATQAELIAIFVDGFDASGGTYDLKADKLTLHPTVAKSPSEMKQGSWASYTISVTPTTITLTPEATDAGPAKKSLSFTLTRAE